MTTDRRRYKRRDNMFRPGQRLYLQENVYDALLRRLRWLMTEFEGRVMLSSSGGKDSCVLFNMTLQVARELGCTPLRLMWIDQEAEWQSTVDIMAKWMRTPDIKPMWHQLPHKIFNASTTVGDPWLHAWDPEAEDVWMHPRDPMAITENVYGTNRFHKLFGRILAHEFPGQTACTIAGVRCEESPNRRMALTAHETYKGETWGGGNGHDEGQFAFYPLYDWSYLDIWKAIHDHGWDYNAIYDAEYRYGIPVTEMRVSNLHHEAAVRWLFYVQEFEPDTYARLARRLPGIDMAGKLGKEDYWVTELPHAFDSWREYRDYLLDNLIENDEWRAGMRRKMDSQEERFDLVDDRQVERMYRHHVRAVLIHDWEGITLHDFETTLPKAVRQSHLYGRQAKVIADAS